MLQNKHAVFASKLYNYIVAAVFILRDYANDNIHALLSESFLDTGGEQAVSPGLPGSCHLADEAVQPLSLHQEAPGTLAEEGGGEAVLPAAPVDSWLRQQVVTVPARGTHLV